MAVCNRNQIHFARFALVLLKSSNLLRVRRPQQDRIVGLLPPSVVSRVTIVLHAIGGELCLLSGSQISHPQVKIPNKCSFCLVGRNRKRNFWSLARLRLLLRRAGNLDRRADTGAAEIASKLARAEGHQQLRGMLWIALRKRELGDRKMPRIVF